jgi:hemerythrin superfamily protein
VDIGSDAQRRSEFPADQPIEALKADHNLARQLFDRFFAAQDVNEKKDLGPHILLLLEMHTSLEEGVFYPRVREADPDLIEHCVQEHDQAKELIERLKLMDEGDPQTEQMYRQLADAIFGHVETEEQQLFPKIQQSGIDLGAIGQEMQIFETTMIAQRHQRPTAPGLRQ